MTQYGTSSTLGASLGALTLGQEGGVFSPGTVRRTGLNMYDNTSPRFDTLPSRDPKTETETLLGGPIEAAVVSDSRTAQAHFFTREIKLKDKHGISLPPTSYTDHYPGKGPLLNEALPEDLLGPGISVPFTSTTEHNDQFRAKPFMGRPMEPLTCQFKSQPWLAQCSTSAATYKGHGPAAGGTLGPQRESRTAQAPPSEMPDIYTTTYGREFTPKEPPGRQPVGEAEPRAYPPWMAGSTTYRGSYIPKDLALQPVLMDDSTGSYPFSGITEQMDEFTPKDPYAVMPPLTGIISRAGLQLPLPRRSLGVEFVQRGVSDKYFVLIPRTVGVPVRAKQVFTTVHDNQEIACILVLYGDDPIASNNILLGQFDITGIPPAPKDVPRIEVSFHLDKTAYLTVEARDLDTERHKLWQQRGQIVELKS